MDISPLSLSIPQKEIYCKENLCLSFEEARKTWCADPEKVILKAAQIKGEA